MSVSVEQAAEIVLSSQTAGNSPESWVQDDRKTTLDTKSPQVKREELNNMEDGELTEDEVSKHLSTVGRSATGLQHVYLSLCIPVSN
ncbi:leucine-rich repeat and guanylate kinase domain-containing protein isoform X1 [Tachysurus ichikawai]